MMEFHVIIPARYDSSRLPGKVLKDIAGKPMLQHVYERALASGAESVLIATDDQRVVKVAEEFGAKVCLTGSHHESGTERIAEAVLVTGYDDDAIIINLQADEPLIPPAVIQQLAEDLDDHDNVKVSTLCHAIDNPQDLFNSNIVKVVFNRRHYAMYFSRAPIPWDINNFNIKKMPAAALTAHYAQYCYHHIGLFAYRAEFLQEYIEWSASPLERIESLEQLRILWNGVRIHVLVLQEKVLPGVNNAEDLEKVREYMAAHPLKF